MKPKTETKTEPDVKLVLRLPKELHAELAAEAQADERSLNSQIVFVLKQRNAKKGKTGT
jgi:predicted HicB family RNase H-like nuclease